MSNPNVFRITEDHLKLVASLNWSSMEHNRRDWAAPRVDRKRPFGNSNIEKDIHRILGTTPALVKDGEDIFSDEQDAYADTLFWELCIVLEICSQLLKFETGAYENVKAYGVKWVKLND